MNANLIFNWLRDDRFAPEDHGVEDAVFLPVELSGPAVIEGPMTLDAESKPGGRVRIELAGGHRIVVEDGFDADALGRLLKVLLS